jgi:hypothetical protein
MMAGRYAHSSRMLNWSLNAGRLLSLVSDVVGQTFDQKMRVGVCEQMHCHLYVDVIYIFGIVDAGAGAIKLRIGDSALPASHANKLRYHNFLKNPSSRKPRVLQQSAKLSELGRVLQNSGTGQSLSAEPLFSLQKMLPPISRLLSMRGGRPVPGFPQPDDCTKGAFVDPPHQVNLLGLFFDVALTNTDRISPPPGTNSVTTKFLQSAIKIGCDMKQSIIVR